MIGKLASLLGLLAVLAGVAAPADADSPAQRVPAAILVFPVVAVEDRGGTRDTRIELVNLSSQEQSLSCFYVNASTCGQFGFSVRLTPNQPLSWLASRGTTSSTSRSAVPGIGSSGELKCRVIPANPGLDAHNVIQGRAIVFGLGGETISYGAVGFQRLTDGELSRVADLDGETYAQCPDEMHYVFVAVDETSDSEIVLAPCTEDLENRVPTTTTVQFLLINEFEQVLSASTTVNCYAMKKLSEISYVFRRETLGSDTGHLIVEGVQSPVLSMLIDRVGASPVTAVAGNEPAFRGGRPATIRFP